MARLNLTVEGQTEQTFAAQLLIPHLGEHGVLMAKPRLAAIARKKGQVHRGGLLGYLPFRNDIAHWLKQDRGSDVYFTTMIDLYGLPRDFPGYAAAASTEPYMRVGALEDALQNDIADPRFLPYIQLHEFEALLFSDPRAFACYYAESERQISALIQLVKQHGNPELIDDGENTAPSKRVAQQFVDYGKRKSAAGPVIAGTIGLDTIRKKCRHFNDWLTKLEGLGTR